MKLFLAFYNIIMQIGGSPTIQNVPGFRSRPSVASELRHERDKTAGHGGKGEGGWQRIGGRKIRVQVHTAQSVI